MRGNLRYYSIFQKNEIEVLNWRWTTSQTERILIIISLVPRQTDKVDDIEKLTTQLLKCNL